MVCRYYYASARLPHWAEYYLATILLLFQVRLALTDQLLSSIISWSNRLRFLRCGGVRVIGSFSADIYLNVLGRKKSLMVSALLFTISAVGTSLLLHVQIHFVIYRISVDHRLRRQQYHRCICSKSHRKTCALLLHAAVVSASHSDLLR